MEIPIWKKNLTSEFFLFQVRRLETLVPKNHFVRELAPFPRSGHNLQLEQTPMESIYVFLEETVIICKEV